MRFEVIQELENNCCRNQLFDVNFEEVDIVDPDAWIREKEPVHDSITREDLPDGIRFIVEDHGLPKIYLLTYVD